MERDGTLSGTYEVVSDLTVAPTRAGHGQVDQSFAPIVGHDVVGKHGAVSATRVRAWQPAPRDGAPTAEAGAGRPD